MADKVHSSRERMAFSDGGHIPDWGFYGREKELEKLDMRLKAPKFTARVVHGRRGVGKTRLLEKAARRCRGSGGRPTVICELPGAPHEDDRALRSLQKVADEVGIDEVFDSLPERQPYHNDGMWFTDVVSHLIRERVNVVLDEFHHAKGTIDGYVKRMIDGFRHEEPDPDTGIRPDRGTLVVMGSHQQKLHEMLMDSQPLHGRFGPGANLKPWSTATVFEMAAEQGLLARPDRFLTLWTAFGGMPNQWERFVVEPEFAALRDFGVWPDGRAWRRAFIEAQRDWLEKHREDRFDNVAYVEIDERHRDVLLWLARERPGGARERRFPQEFRERRSPGLDGSLKILRDHLGLVEDQDEYQGNGSQRRWKLTDPVARFQLDVLGIGILEGQSASKEGLYGMSPLERLERVEGGGLERLAAETLRALPGARSVMADVRRYRDASGKPVDGAAPDMDILVQPYPDAGRPMVFGECKRDVRKLFDVDLDAAIGRLMNRIPVYGKTGILHELPRRKLLVAPEIPEDARLTLRSRGAGAGGNYECMDILDLACVSWDLRARAREVEAEAKAWEYPLTRIIGSGGDHGS